jgi:hypothetical protein
MPSEETEKEKDGASEGKRQKNGKDINVLGKEEWK